LFFSIGNFPLSASGCPNEITSSNFDFPIAVPIVLGVKKDYYYISAIAAKKNHNLP
jgi:hypothetical protein